MSDDKKPGTPADDAAVPGLLASLKALARRLKIEVHTLWLIFRHKETPWYAKAILVLLLVYLMSPIDLIPDVIPVLGMLDDIVVIALALWLAYRMTPKPVIEECRTRANEADREDWIKALWQKFKEW
jgi:uncharacterized membrane protein YkvA (DUF1232 family)